MARRKNKLYDVELLESNEVQGEMDFQTALQRFIGDCRIRNLKEHTLIYYKRELQLYKRTLEEQGIDPTPHLVNKNIINKNVILYMLEEQECKEVTVNTRLRAVRTFYNFLEKENLIQSNPFHEVKFIKHNRRIIQTFSKEQVRLLLDQPDGSSFTGIRDLTIMMLLLETGVRANECISIDVKDINWTDHNIRIKEPKGSKERIVPIQKRMQKQLRKYLNIRGRLEEVDALFVSIDNQRLSKRQLQNLISKYGRQAGIKDVRCSPHTFRHTMAKLSVQRGADIFTLQAILGHSSLEMVRVYVHLFSSDVYENHKKFSPIERLY
ncbi:tyrosine-type recombinase/integrase [Bacillaceae bacterium S4-13-58]